MEQYLPFIAHHWQHITLAGVSLLLGVSVEKWLSSKSVGNQIDEKPLLMKSATKKKAPRQEDVDSDVVEDSLEDDEEAPANVEELARILYDYSRPSVEESISRSLQFYRLMSKRRSVRHISGDPVREEWSVSGKTWVADLKHIGTNWIKEYLTTAPWIILVFKQVHGWTPDGRKKAHYYNEISTSIAAGFLLAAIQNAGLVTVTTTPLNCGPALRSLLNRPVNEKLMLLLPVGYPQADATVPDLKRKTLDDIMVLID